MRTISVELMDYNTSKVSKVWWKQLMSLFLKSGREFEIRHWREEKEIVEKACAYGKISDDDSTDFEVSIKGKLTDYAVNNILNGNKSYQNDRLTEFFTIKIENIISCEHYGKEIYIFNATDEIWKQISEIFTPIKEYFTFNEYGE